jgi:hypothetical protein
MDKCWCKLYRFEVKKKKEKKKEKKGGGAIIHHSITMA